MIAEIAQRHGAPVAPVVQVNGQGSVNRVFVIGTGAARHVVRLPIDPQRDEFEVEEWCLRCAAMKGIPSPVVVARGRLGGVPYLVQEFVEGVPGDRQPSLTHWATLGAYGRRAHQFDLTDAPSGLFTRFGRDPQRAWRQHLQYNLDRLTHADPLLQLGVYPKSKQPHLRHVLTELMDRDMTHGLCHGDLAPRNLLIQATTSPVLLDWGSAAVGPVPYGDLIPAMKSHLATGSPSIAELNVLATALGAPLPRHNGLLDQLMILDALDLVRWAIDQRPDRLTDLASAAGSYLANS